MRRVSGFQSVLALVVLVSLSMPSLAVGFPSGTTGSFEGRLLGTDGAPAPGHRVHLIGVDGESRASAPTSAEGRYSMDQVPAGSYVVGVENDLGQRTVVVGSTVDVKPGTNLQADVKLYEGRPMAEGDHPPLPPTEQYKLGIWWAGLSPAAKTWTVLGIVAVVGVTVAALDDDDNETEASPF